MATTNDKMMAAGFLELDNGMFVSVRDITAVGRNSLRQTMVAIGEIEYVSEMPLPDLVERVASFQSNRIDALMRVAMAELPNKLPQLIQYAAVIQQFYTGAKEMAKSMAQSDE